jgi:hypothetical protein
MFTTDHSISGEKFKHEDKDFSAIKTHNNLKIYSKGNEVARFDLNTEYLNSGSHATLTNFVIKDRLAILNNVGKIADVLNHYDITRGDQNDYGVKQNTFSRIAKSGLTYSYDNGWKGMKSGPKHIESSKIDKSNYEIFSFKRDFLIKDSKTHQLVATLKGHKVAGDSTLYVADIKMEDERAESYDMVADALEKINIKPNTTVKLSDQVLKTEERTHLDNELNKRGYVGTGYRWGAISDQYPSEVISKGTGGTWIKEAYSSIDIDIKELQRRANEYRGKYNPSEEDNDPDFAIIQKYNKFSNLLSDDLYTLYNRKTPILRVLVERGSLKIIYKPSKADNGEGIVHTVKYKDEIEKYGNVLARLLTKIDASVGELITSRNLYISKGKMKDMSKNPKLTGFMNGEIMYEDGHTWKKSGRTYRNSQTWFLRKDGKGDMIEVELSEDGIKSMKFQNSDVRRNTKFYRAFIIDLMDISDEIYGT